MTWENGLHVKFKIWMSDMLLPTLTADIMYYEHVKLLLFMFILWVFFF